MNSGSEISRVIQHRNSTSNISDIITSDSFINRILNKRITNNNQNLIQIEEEIDIDQNLELYKNLKITPLYFLLKLGLELFI